MKIVHSLIVACFILISVSCSQTTVGVNAQPGQVQLQKDNQGTFEILGEASGKATITKFMFLTFGDEHSYTKASGSIRGLVERAALHDALENFAGADGLVTPVIITKVSEFLFYAKYESTVKAKAVKVVPGGNKANTFTNLWTFN